MIAWSANGTTFDPPMVFQDSSGVPSVIRWHGDTLIAAFQWFRQPIGSPSWDRVAVKFSYDNGLSWNEAIPIVMGAMPPGQQRPFDPTLTAIDGDSLRLFFSSSAAPPTGLDATVNTYSAVSADGVNWIFEPGARVDHPALPLIDPAVIRFGPGWHYASPKGAPQDGAHHHLSSNGTDFAQVPDIPSDAQHNWTGNYMVNGPNELRFYGSGPLIWYNSSPNGGQWNGFVSTNVQGGDPSVLKVADGTYLMIYVGQPAITGVACNASNMAVKVSPVPAADHLEIHGVEAIHYRILSSNGGCLVQGPLTGKTITVQWLPAGLYLVQLTDASGVRSTLRFVKE